MALPKQLTTITPFSKYLALSLFVILPLVFFYLGMKYQEQNTPQVQIIQQTPQYIPASPTSMFQPTQSTSEVEITYNDNKKTIPIKKGSMVKLILNSTYWQMDKPSSSILQQQGEPIYTVDHTVKIPGTGAGTVTALYQAVGIGTAMLTASRSSCGEALACPPDLAHFSVILTITE
jgi:hypothetical protein